MWETCAVELQVQLPKSVAAEVEEVKKRDPAMLSRMVLYALTRRTIYEHLSERDVSAVAVDPAKNLDVVGKPDVA